MQQKDQLIAQAVDELNKHLKALWLPLLHASEDLISKKYPKDELEKKLFEVLDKKESYTHFIKSVYPTEIALQQKPIPIARKAVSKELHDLRQNLAVVVDGDTLINYCFCPECKPKLWSKIIAKTGRDGIKIHSVDCRWTKTIAFDKLLEAHRLGESENHYMLSLEFTMTTKQGKMLNMLKIFAELNIRVLQVTMKNLDNNLSMIAFETEFSNPGKIAFLLNSLKKYDDSLKVTKKTIT